MCQFRLFGGANPTFGWCRNHPGGAHGNTWGWHQGGKVDGQTDVKKFSKKMMQWLIQKNWFIPFGAFGIEQTKSFLSFCQPKWQGRAPFILWLLLKNAVQVDAVSTARAAVTDPAAQVERLSTQISRLWLACSYCLCWTTRIQSDMIKLEVERQILCFKFQPCCTNHFGCCSAHPFLLTLLLSCRKQGMWRWWGIWMLLPAKFGTSSMRYSRWLLNRLPEILSHIELQAVSH